jgi:hypothetical protein
MQIVSASWNEVLIVVNLHYYNLYNLPKPIASEEAKIPISRSQSIHP